MTRSFVPVHTILRYCFAMSALIGAFAALVAAQTTGDDLLSHAVVRITGPDVRAAVEPSVAINPTRPDHIVAVSHQPSRPGSTNFAYVSEDGGKTWKMSSTPNPERRTQGDDSVAFTADGTAVHMYIAFAGLRL